MGEVRVECLFHEIKMGIAAAWMASFKRFVDREPGDLGQSNISGLRTKKFASAGDIPSACHAANRCSRDIGCAGMAACWRWAFSDCRRFSICRFSARVASFCCWRFWLRLCLCRWFWLAIHSRGFRCCADGLDRSLGRLDLSAIQPDQLGHRPQIPCSGFLCGPFISPPDYLFHCRF